MPLGTGTNQQLIGRPAGFKAVGNYGGGKGTLFTGPGGGMTSAAPGSKIGTSGSVAAPGTQLVEDQLNMPYEGAVDYFKSLGAYSPEGVPQDSIAQLRQKLLQNRGAGTAQY